MNELSRVSYKALYFIQSIIKRKTNFYIFVKITQMTLLENKYDSYLNDTKFKITLKKKSRLPRSDSLAFIFESLP